MQQIGIADDAPFLSYFSGNTIQICPVGALTSAEYRFRSRPFDLVSTPGVAEHDSCGAAIRVDHRRGKVMRRLAGNDPEVNEEWISDKDRFAFHYARQDDRLTHPMVARGRRAPARVVARGLRRRGPRPAGGRRQRRADRWPRDRRGRLRLRQVRPGRARHQRHRLPRPPAHRRGGRLPGLASSRCRMDVVVRRPRARLRRRARRASSPRTRRRRSSCGCARRRRARRKVVALAPFTTRGLGKMNGRLVPTAPGDEAEALRALADDGHHRPRRRRRDPRRRAAGPAATAP